MFHGRRLQRAEHIDTGFPRGHRYDFPLAFDRPAVAQFGSHGGMSGIKEKQRFPFWQVVFERAVCVDEFELCQGIGLGWGRLAFFERKVIAREPISHAREGEFDTEKAFDFLDDRLCAGHITGGQDGAQPGSLLWVQFTLGAPALSAQTPVVEIVLQVPTGSLFVDEEKLGDLGKTLALAGKQYDFHTVARLSITLDPMGRFEGGSLAGGEKI